MPRLQRPRLATAANLIAWFVLAALILVALLIANRLGFPGLILLGAATWLVCTLATLDGDGPTWSQAAFKARMARPRSPEQRAALAEERRQAQDPLRFYARCGMAIAALGAAGTAWQAWSP